MNADLIRQVRHSLMKEWDPIGVDGIEDAADEYDNYVGPLCDLITKRVPENEIFDYLWWLETEQIGLYGNRAATKAFAKRLSLLIAAQ